MIDGVGEGTANRSRAAADTLRTSTVREYGSEHEVRERLAETLGVPDYRPPYVEGCDMAESVEIMRMYADAIASNAEMCARTSTRRDADSAAERTDPSKATLRG